MRFHKEIYGDDFVNALIAETEGQRYHSRPFAWTDGESKYSHIAGAIYLPEIGRNGYLITVGVRYEDQRIDVLEEFESAEETEIIAKAREIKEDYGDGLSMFYSEPSRLMPIVNTDGGTYLPVSQALDADAPDAFQIYISQLMVSINNRNKILYLNTADILRSNLKAYAGAVGTQAKDFPVLYAAGSLIHTIVTLRPWEHAVDTTRIIPIDNEVWSDEREISGSYEEIYG
jgi:hypothetical protein